MPILERKPGALRNGAPFKDFKLPGSIQKARTRLTSHPDGDKEFIKILLEVKKYGLDKIDKVCSEALSVDICNADLIVQRIKQKPQTTPELELSLEYPPDSDCNCYDEKLLKKEKKND